MNNRTIKLIGSFMFIIVLLFNFSACSKSINVEGEWYTVVSEVSDENSIDALIVDLSEPKTYVVKEKIDVTKDHFIIDGAAYTYTVDENYVIVSNSHTYEFEEDEKYGEVLIYDGEIIAYKDKEKAQIKADEMTTE